jgi:hypothetical protein
VRWLSRPTALLVVLGLLAACTQGGSASVSTTPTSTAAAIPTPATASAAFAGVQRAYSSPVLDGGRPLTFFMGAEY